MVTVRFENRPKAGPDPLLERLRATTAGKYDISGELGRGGMAIVYVAWDLQLQRHVAIKVMRPELLITEGADDLIARFVDEARRLAGLDHPNIVKIHDIKNVDGLLYFEMPLIQGGTVSEFREFRDGLAPGQFLPINQIKWILQKASQALAHAHSKGVVHRDVKPANILISIYGDIILTDFGISKAMASNVGVTRSGQIIGTPEYMSPEQFSSLPPEPASDQYALGISAYQLITGEVPFRGDWVSLMRAHSDKAPTPLQHLRPDCPDILADGVMQMLEKDPKDRWPSMSDLQSFFSQGSRIDWVRVQGEVAERVSRMSKGPPGGFPPDTPDPTKGRLLEILQVTLLPPAATIHVGSSHRFSAQIRSEAGEDLPNIAVEWSSLNPETATIDSNGVVVGLRPGVAEITATAGEEVESATVVVEPAPIKRLALGTPKLQLQVGATAKPVVTAIDVNERSLTDAAFIWRSRDPHIVDVDSDSPGQLRALATGVAHVEILLGRAKCELEVTVVRRRVTTLRIRAINATIRVGSKDSLTVEATDDLGNVVFPSDVRWSSNAPDAVQVDSLGTARAMEPGVAEVMAEVDGVRATVELEAVEAPIGGINLSVTRAILEVGEETALRLAVTNATGGPRSAAGVELSNSAPEVAHVNAETLQVRALSAGSTVISAIANGVQATVHLEVKLQTIAAVVLTPPSLDLENGMVTQVHATFNDRRGNAFSGVKAQWHSSAPDIVSISSAGVVRARAVGDAELRIQAINLDGTALDAVLPVRVRRPSLARLNITADASTIVVGDRTVVRIQPADTSGTPMPDVKPAWRSTNVGVATVSNEGVLAAISAGDVQIIAEAEGQAEHLAIRVLTAPLRSLNIRAPGDIVVGVPVAFAVDAIDVTGVPVLTAVDWSVLPPDAATISGSGQLTARTPSAFTVRASVSAPAISVGKSGASGAREANARVTARSPKVAAIVLDQAAIRLRVGARARIGTKVILEGQSTAQTAHAAWTSANVSVLRVERPGEVVAESVGETTVTVSAGDVLTSLRVSVVPARNPAALRLGAGAIVGVFALALTWYFRPGSSIPVSDGTSLDADSIAVAAADEKARVAAVADSMSQLATAVSVREARVADSAKPAVVANSRNETSQRESASDSKSKQDSMRRARQEAENRTIARGRQQAEDSAAQELQRRASQQIADSVEKARVAATAAAQAIKVAAGGDASTPINPRVTGATTSAPNLSSNEWSLAAACVAERVRTRTESNPVLVEFFRDGAEHKVEALPVSAKPAANGLAHGEFRLKLSKFTSGGTRWTRVGPVEIAVGKAGSCAEVKNIVYGAFK